LVKPRPSQEDIDRDEMLTLGIEDLAELGRKRIREAVPTAVKVIRDVMEQDAFDQSLDSARLKLRFDAAKYIIDRAFGSTSPTTGEFAGEKESKITKFLAQSVVDYPDESE
jgi:hypothetical protein